MSTSRQIARKLSTSSSKTISQLRFSPLRPASIQNRINYSEGLAGASCDRCVFRQPHIIAQDMRSLVVSLNGWYQNGSAGEANISNSYTIVSMSIEGPSGTVVPIYFSGSRSVTINPGDVEVQSDSISPRSFSSAMKFNRGDTYYIKGIVSFSAGGKVPSSAAFYNTTTQGQSHFYVAAATTPTSTDVSGKYTFSGTAPTAAVLIQVSPMLLGVPVIYSGNCIMTIGDSIGYGTGESAMTTPSSSTEGNYGVGMMQRAMHDVSKTNASLRPNLNFCRYSSKIANFNTDTKWRNYLKYVDVVIQEGGYNDGLNVATMQGLYASIWGVLRSYGIKKVFNTKLTLATTSTDSWATEANQTYLAQRGPGGQMDTINTWIDSKVTDGTINGTAVINSGGVDNHKWAVTGAANYATADGIHPSDVKHEDAAVALRAMLVAAGI